jgi:GTP 3',8-cyclase
MTNEGVDMMLDGHKLMLHPDKAALWKKTGDCYPLHVEIGLTGRCNQKCIFCALDFVNHKSEDIDKDVMIKTLEDMAQHEVRSVMFGGEGEPLIYPYIGLATRRAKEYGLDVAITTNGSMLNQEKIKQCLPYLSWIKFSVDAGTPESYSKIHGVSSKTFGRVIENIRNAVEFKKKNGLEVTIGTQFLVIPQSIDSAEKAAEILRDIGANYLAIKPYSHHPRSKNDFTVSKSQYNGLEKKMKKFSTDSFKVYFRKKTIQRLEEGNIYPECYGLPFISLIDSKGNVLPCNLFYDQPEFIYGNLYEKSFSEIWESEQRKQVLQRMKKRGVEGCRHGCRLDAMNSYLDRLKHPQKHDNFS